MHSVSFLDVRPQLTLLIVALLIGVFAGLLFDIYRRIRNRVSPGPFFTALGDLCFWGIITWITFSSLLRINFGQVRGYVFLGIIIGLFFYMLFFSSGVIWIFVLLENYFKRGKEKLFSLRRRFTRLKVFTLPKRIVRDARRIYFKIKKR